MNGQDDGMYAVMWMSDIVPMERVVKVHPLYLIQLGYYLSVVDQRQDFIMALEIM